MTPIGTLPRQTPQDAAPTSELSRRIASAVVLAAVAIGATLLSPWTFLVLVVVMSVAVTWEWGRLVRGDGADAIAILQSGALTAAAILVAFAYYWMAAGTLACTAVLIAILERHHPQRAGWSLVGLLYGALAVFALIWLRGRDEGGALAILFILVVSWATDTAAYAGGRLLGGPKLAPRISPKKTWSGFIIGTLAAGLIGYAFASATGGSSAMQLAVVAVVLALACHIGDLLESAVKRHFGTKDMSQLIPGHGGVLDRIDGFLLASIVAAAIALRDPAQPAASLLVW